MWGSNCVKALAAVLALGLASTAHAANAPLEASVTGGRIEGAAKGATIEFLGVPFAAPPVGQARWKAPGAVKPWDGVRKTTAFSASCTQVLNPKEGRAPWTPEYMIPGAMSEDCLYLNVWRPANAATKVAPVFVWLHGGGNVEGSGSIDIYNGAAMAAKGVVVVTINYRLGVLGFYTNAALSKEQGGVSGNYGLQDIVAALKWVQANAAAFGGDPARVTVGGQSAGAGDTNAMIATPAAKGLFARTITESGSAYTGVRAQTLASQEARGADFAQKVGATSLEELRAIPANVLFKVAADYGRFGPVVDGRFMPTDQMRAQTVAGGFNDTPVLSGYNADEASGSDAKYGAWTAEEFAKVRATAFGPVAADAAKLYAANDSAQIQTVGKAMMRDRSRANAYQWAKRRAAATKNPIYVYYFDHPHPGPDVARFGTFHTSEVPYVFGNLSATRPFTAADRKVSDAMMTRWVNFIKGGAPNAPGQPAWPAFNAAKPMVMHLGDKEGPQPFTSADKLALSDALVNKTEAAQGVASAQ
jgi:para-nitrobenzyl esterase